MAAMMERRGPDDQGSWSDSDGHVQLGFRRLAILDLSQGGHQPMVSGDGRSVIVFNGEIYNFVELRRELEQLGIRFRSRSDTEVLLEALNRWGTDALARLNGMFAIAWYNLVDRTLLLARDHAGIKPLYYFVQPGGRGVAFASQYNVLLHTPWGEPGDVQLDVLHLYLRLHHIPPPYGLLRNTYQLEPGHFLIVQPNGVIEKRCWWSLPRDVEPDLRGQAALEALDGALEHAVRRQRIADVPLGVFLSGGVDSPLVTAVARQQSNANLKAFTIANPGWWQDETEAAAAYARQLEVDHQVHAAIGDESLVAIQEAMKAQHEPFADFSILPTLLVSRFARSQVTVALSGDGGDELFFGYERPRSLLRDGPLFRWPWVVRAALYGAGKYGVARRRSDVIVARTPANYYFDVNCRVSEADLRTLAPELPPLPADFDLYAFQEYRGQRHLAGYSRWVEFYGQLQRGLKKVDMASMYHSLEVRVPLLDREVVETALRIDPFDCLRGGERKAVLRDLLSKYVPAETIPLPKRGFAVPLGEWLRNPLRLLVEESLFGTASALGNTFDRGGLRRYWEDHRSGRRDLKWGLWTLLALEWWLSAKNKL